VSRRVVTSRRADSDIESAVDHYLDEGAHEAALDFVDSLDDARSLISAHPTLGSSRFAVETGIDGLRSFALRRFPFVLLYTDDADAVRVHRVLHTSRDLPAEFSGA